MTHRIEVRYTDKHNRKSGRVRFLDVATGQLFNAVVDGFLMCSGWKATGRTGEYHEGGGARITDILYLCGCQEQNVADCAPTCDKPHAEQFRKLHEPGQQYTALAPVLSTEAKRDTGKPRFDLLEDGCPDALLDVVKVMTWAVEVKGYRAHSWKEVPEARRRYRAAMSRHRNALARGELLDDESGLPHEAHIACNAIFLAQLLYIKPE